MKGVKLIVPAIILILVVVFQSLFIVQEISQAIVLQFGDPKKIVTKAGLNFKLPFIQNVVYLDKRILNLDNDPEEVIAADQKRLIVDAIARFKIVDPLKFYISVGNERVARSRLSTIINSRIRSVLGTQRLQTLLSEDRNKQMALIQEGVNNEANNYYVSSRGLMKSCDYFSQHPVSSIRRLMEYFPLQYLSGYIRQGKIPVIYVCGSSFAHFLQVMLPHINFKFIF